MSSVSGSGLSMNIRLTLKAAQGDFSLKFSLEETADEARHSTRNGFGDDQTGDNENAFNFPYDAMQSGSREEQVLAV